MPDSRPKRIVVLIDHIDSDYHVEVVRGVVRAGHRARVKTLIVTGGWLGKPDTEGVTRNFIYDLLAQARVDGLVVMAGSLSNACGVPRFLEWVQRFNHLPIVMAGLDVPNYPSVYVNNETGVYKVVTHLIKEHQRHRIAFIGGSSNSIEVAARRNAYFRALKDNGLEVDERLVVRDLLDRDAGGLSREVGELAVAELLDARHFAPATLEAIICAADVVAFGSVDELTRRGIAVPGGTAVVGFDDTASARTFNPPLTTVNQRVDLQSFTAAQALIQSLEGGPSPKSVVIDSEPVMRVSCGCAAHFQNDTVDAAPASFALARSCRLALIERRVKIAAELSRAASGSIVGKSGWESRLLDSLVRDLATGEVSAFLGAVEGLTRHHIAAGNDITTCHDVLTTLRQQVVACSVVEPAVRPRLEDMFQEARHSIARLGADFDNDHQRQLNRQLRVIVRSCLALSGKGTLTDFGATLAESLPQLGIRAHSILRFAEKCGPNETLEVLARQTLAIGISPNKYALGRELGIDPALEQEEALVVSPLEFEDTPVGIAVFSWGAYNPPHYEQLREVIGAAVHCHSQKLRPAQSNCEVVGPVGAPT